MSATDNLEQKAREWLNTEGYMHLGLRLTKRGHTGDSDLPEQVLAAFARSLAPPPSGAVVEAGNAMKRWIEYAAPHYCDEQDRYNAQRILDAWNAAASSPSEPTVDKQVDKIMEVVMTWYKNPKRGGLGFTMQDGIDLLRNEIKALLSR